MAKTKFEKELEKESQSNLCRRCEGKGLPHTGDKDALIARLVEWEKAQPKEVEPPEPEPEEPEAESEPAVEPPPEE